jgi:cell division ATPase FtsA
MSIVTLFKKDKSNGKIKKSAVLVDVGSSSVTTSLVFFENNISTVVAIETTDISILTDLSYSGFEREMQKALSASLNKILHNVTIPLSFINVCLSSPWFASQVRTAKLSRSTPFVASKIVLDDMVKRELKAFEEEQVKEKILQDEKVRVIESQTIKVRLNGYEINDPVGLSAKELELTIFISIASENTLKSIEDIIGKVFTSPIMFSSFLSMTYLVSRDFFPHQENYVLIDIGGEVTDISLVKNRGLLQSLSFPCGRNFILRHLAGCLKRTIPESKTLWTLHSENKTNGKVKEICEIALTDAKNEWQTMFQKSLYNASKDLYIPNVIFLTIEDDLVDWFIDTIKNEQFHQSLLAGMDFKVIPLNSALFKDLLVFGQDVPRNSSIIIETMAVRYYFNEK